MELLCTSCGRLLESVVPAESFDWDETPESHGAFTKTLTPIGLPLGPFCATCLRRQRQEAAAYGKFRAFLKSMGQAKPTTKKHPPIAAMKRKIKEEAYQIEGDCSLIDKLEKTPRMLSTWEREFVAAVTERVRIGKRLLSDKQREVVEQILSGTWHSGRTKWPRRSR